MGYQKLTQNFEYLTNMGTLVDEHFIRLNRLLHDIPDNYITCKATILYDGSGMGYHMTVDEWEFYIEKSRINESLYLEAIYEYQVAKGLKALDKIKNSTFVVDTPPSWFRDAFTINISPTIKELQTEYTKAFSWSFVLSIIYYRLLSIDPEWLSANYVALLADQKAQEIRTDVDEVETAKREHTKRFGTWWEKLLT